MSTAEAAYRLGSSHSDKERRGMRLRATSPRGTSPRERSPRGTRPCRTRPSDEAVSDYAMSDYAVRDEFVWDEAGCKWARDAAPRGTSTGDGASTAELTA